jgi:ADP-ribosylglycohydrolase
MNQFQDKQRGCLLGLALGAAVEFKRPGTFEPVTGYRAGGPHGLEPGEWTDDTSMALALADSIAASGWDINDQARRYVAWWTQGEYSVNGRCFDIGITTSSALSRFQQTGDGNTSGDSSDRASGNGSIMRLAPVPIRFAGYFPDQIEQLAQRAIESTRRRLRDAKARSPAVAEAVASRERAPHRDQVPASGRPGPASCSGRPRDTEGWRESVSSIRSLAGQVVRSDRGKYPAKRIGTGASRMIEPFPLARSDESPEVFPLPVC